MPKTQVEHKAAFAASEFHYFRVPRDRWPLLLARIRQLGATTIVAPVVWAWHAPSADLLDLDGSSHPQRDLRALLELCAQLDLKLMLNVGPRFHLGLLNDGLPLWLAKRYPEARALQADGSIDRDPLSGLERLSLLHPSFLAALERWYGALNRLVSDQQAPDGPLVALLYTLDGPLQECASRFVDYNAAVVSYWQEWLQATFESLELLNERWQSSYRSFGKVPLSHQFAESDHFPPKPQSIDYARFWAACADRFVQYLAAMLSAPAWRVPLLAVHSDLPEQSGLAQSDCLGLNQLLLQQQRLLDKRTPLQLLPIPLRQSEPWALALAFESGQGLLFEHAVQSFAEPAAIASGVTWAEQAALQADGKVTSSFWYLKGLLSLFDGLGEASRPHAINPALRIGISRNLMTLHNLKAARSIAGESSGGRSLGELLQRYDQRCSQLACMLTQVGVPFGLIDLDTASLEELQAQDFVLVPESPLFSQELFAKLAFSERLFVLSDPHDSAQQRLPAHKYLAMPSSLEEWNRLLEAQIAWRRNAWADQPDIDLQLRYAQPDASNEPLVFLWVANRRSQNYSGMIAYRAYDGSIEHVYVTIGPQRSGLLVLQKGDLVAVSMDGDYSEGSWSVRALRSSVAWSGGSALIAPYNLDHEHLTLLVSSSHSGKLSIRRPDAWPELSAYRLLLNGELMPVELQIKQELLTLNYLAEDRQAHSEAYLICPAKQVLNARLRHSLNAQLVARACMLDQQAQRLATAQGNLRQERMMLQAVAAQYEALANDHYTPESYQQAWRVNQKILQQAIDALKRQLIQARAALGIFGESEAQAQRATLLEQVLLQLSAL